MRKKNMSIPYVQKIYHSKSVVVSGNTPSPVCHLVVIGNITSLNTSQSQGCEKGGPWTLAIGGGSGLGQLMSSKDM